MNPNDLSFLLGDWKWLESGVKAYGRRVHGELKLVYRFGGVGQIFDWRQTGNVLVARFRWVSGSVSGFMHLKPASADRLEGGWWSASADAPHPVFKPGAPPATLVLPFTWERQPQSEVLPEWAEKLLV